MNEVWKDIYFIDFRNGKVYDYRGKYQVSNLGRVKSLCNHPNAKEFIGHKNEKRGYVEFTIRDIYGEEKHWKVHQLVAFMFLEIPDDIAKNQINHIDENGYNNCVDNLEWCTCKYNLNYGSHNEKMRKTLAHKIGQYDIKTKKLIKIWYGGSREIERELGASHQNIIRCCKYYENQEEYMKTHKYPCKSVKGYIWRYYKESSDDNE